MNVIQNNGLTRGARAWWDGDEDDPLFAHESCLPNGDDEPPWRELRSGTELIDGDYCIWCRCSMFDEPNAQD